MNDTDEFFRARSIPSDDAPPIRAAFVQGVALGPEALRVRVERLDGRGVELRDRVVVSDPWHLRGAVPLERAIAPGGYYGWLSVVDTPDGPRVAAALLEHARQESLPANPSSPAEHVVRWEPAGHVCVDRGQVAFCAPELIHAAERMPALPSSFAIALAEPGLAIEVGLGADNLLAVSIGGGDGRYGVWWGIDTTGKPACIVVDGGLWTGAGEVEDEAYADWIRQVLGGDTVAHQALLREARARCDLRRTALALATGEPSPEAWSELMAVLRALPSHELPDACAALEPRLARWPDSLRVAGVAEWRDALYERAAPALGLARALDRAFLEVADQDEGFTECMLRHPAAEKVRRAVFAEDAPGADTAARVADRLGRSLSRG